MGLTTLSFWRKNPWVFGQRPKHWVILALGFSKVHKNMPGLFQGLSISTIALDRCLMIRNLPVFWGLEQPLLLAGIFGAFLLGMMCRQFRLMVTSWNWRPFPGADASGGGGVTAPLQGLGWWRHSNPQQLPGHLADPWGNNLSPEIFVVAAEDRWWGAVLFVVDCSRLLLVWGTDCRYLDWSPSSAWKGSFWKC